jgi:hypothetical protein
MDDESKTLSRFFPEAQKIDIREADSHDVMVEKIIEDGEDLVVADLKAGSGRDTLDWWLGLPFDQLQNVRFICIGSITSSPDSSQSFLNWAAALKNKVSYFVFKNHKDGDVFTDYDGTEQARGFRWEYRPIHVDIPRLQEKYMTELERLNLTISAILEANGSEFTLEGKPIDKLLCKLLVRARLRDFQNRIYQQFRPILKLLNVQENVFAL